MTGGPAPGPPAITAPTRLLVASPHLHSGRTRSAREIAQQRLLRTLNPDLPRTQKARRSVPRGRGREGSGAPRPWPPGLGGPCRCRMRRNSATPWAASEPNKPNPAGALMPHSANGTGIDPAACSADASRRPGIVTVTRCAVPFIVSSPVAVVVMVAPAVKAGLRVTGCASVKVAAGNRAVPRLLASCGWVLPLTLMLVRPMRNVALVTWPPEMTMVPVRALVRPTTSLLMPMALSGTRKPATDPGAACQVPPAGPDGGLTDPAGSVSGGGAGCLMNTAIATTTSATSATTPARIHRSGWRRRADRSRRYRVRARGSVSLVTVSTLWETAWVGV